LEEIIRIKNRVDKKKYILSYLPSNLKNLIGDKKKILYKGRNLKTAYLIDIVHSLIQKHLQSGKNSFNLLSTISKEKYGPYYNFYYNYLLENRIIKLTSDYWVGNKSKTYSLPIPTLREFDSYKNRDTILLKKNKKLFTVNYLKKINYNHIDFNVRKKLLDYIADVDIKYSEAKTYLDSLKLTDNQRTKNLHSIIQLKDYDYWYSFDDFGRFHNNLTTLKSNIRHKHILLDGEKTKELDISNSQPTFLTYIMKDYDNIDKEEYLFFKQLIVKGKLYDYVMNNTDITDRKKIKMFIYTVLFGTNNLRKIENKVFKKLFPSIFKWIKWFKKEKGDYKSLATELQRSESNFLFNSICKEIIAQYPNLPFFTVHDSITVKESDYDKVKKIFEYHIKLLHLKL
jgi:hypothetical protein